MEFVAPPGVRQAMAEGLRQSVPGGVAFDTARRGADGRGLSVSALRRLVRWHVEHPGELGVELLLHGGREGEAWARVELQRWADSCASGENTRGAVAAFGATMRAAGSLVGDDGGSLMSAGRTVARAAGGGGRLFSLLGMAARPFARAGRSAASPAPPAPPPTPPPAPPGARPVEAWADGRPVRAWVEVEGVAPRGRRR